MSLKEKDYKDALANGLPRGSSRIKRLKANILSGFTSSVKKVVESRLARRLGASKDKVETTIAIMPQNFRYLNIEKNLATALIEEPPHTRTINTSKGHFHLSMPYVLHLVTIGINNRNYVNSCGYAIAVRNKPIQSSADAVYLMPLPNGYEGGSVCMGDFTGETLGKMDSADFTQETGSVVKYLNGCVVGYWGTQFSEWGFYSVSAYERKHRDQAKPHARNPYKVGNWSNETKKNPACALQKDWIPLHHATNGTSNRGEGDYQLGAWVKDFTPSRRNKENDRTLNDVINAITTEIVNSCNQEITTKLPSERAWSTILEDQGNDFVKRFSKAFAEKIDALEEIDPALAEMMAETVYETLLEVAE